VGVQASANVTAVAHIIEIASAQLSASAALWTYVGFEVIPAQASCDDFLTYNAYVTDAVLFPE